MKKIGFYSKKVMPGDGGGVLKQRSIDWSNISIKVYGREERVWFIVNLQT